MASAGKGIDEDALLPLIPSLQRLALAYAPARARPLTLAVLALDSRLAALVRGSSAPLLAQLRLAWWRDRLGEEAGLGPQGEPVLAALRVLGIASQALVPLVDGWEAMTGEHPLEPAAFAVLADARGEAFAALADALGHPSHGDAARGRGKAWALADLATRVGSEVERARARDLAEQTPIACGPLPRDLRPVIVLHGVALRRLRRGASEPGLSPGDLAAAMRLGIAGR
jgi:15-cis-phytoene synthase